MNVVTRSTQRPDRRDGRDSRDDRRTMAWAIIGVACALTLAACGGGSADLVGLQRDPVPAVGAASLPIAGTCDELSFVAPEGGVLVVYFGFTHCPDICPTTLADLKLALDDLGDDAQRVEVAMATVDPERDTDEVVTGYVQSFVPDAVALRTDDETVLRNATNAFGADYVITEDEDGEPEVGHTTSLYAVDDEGNMVLTWAFGTTSEDIASDLGVLLDQA